MLEYRACAATTEVVREQKTVAHHWDWWCGIQIIFPLQKILLSLANNAPLLQ